MVGEIFWHINKDCKIQVWVEFTKLNVYGQLEQKPVYKEKLFFKDQILEQLWK
jgi:hypothetical protein